jgi:hypothetical protein
MFKRSNEGSSDGTRAPRRREERGLGPFTSGHLTLIVITLLILVAFPFAAFAVTGNNVFVTDATSGNHATVANGRLKVDAGTAFGLVPTVNAGGPLDARPALPTSPIVISSRQVSLVAQTLYGPASKPFAIGSLTIANQCSTSDTVMFYSVTNPGGTTKIVDTSVAGTQTVHLSYPIPLVTTPPLGGTASLLVNTGGATTACLTVSGVGYQS